MSLGAERGILDNKSPGTRGYSLMAQKIGSRQEFLIRKDCDAGGVWGRCSESHGQSSLRERGSEIRRTRKNTVVTVQI